MVEETSGLVPGPCEHKSICMAKSWAKSGMGIYKISHTSRYSKELMGWGEVKVAESIPEKGHFESRASESF